MLRTIQLARNHVAVWSWTCVPWVIPSGPWNHLVTMGKTQDGGLPALLPLLLSSPWRSCRTKRESHHRCSAENEKERLWLLFWLCSVGQWEKSMTGVTKYLWKGYFFTSKLPESQERLKSDLIFSFMASFFMSTKKTPWGLCLCVLPTWFPKNHAPAGHRWSTACLTIFPPCISVPPVFRAVGREAQELAYISSTLPGKM